MNPVQSKNHKDCRVDWLSYKNINDWTDMTKEYLINIGMLKDAPEIICKWYYSILLFPIMNLSKVFTPSLNTGNKWEYSGTRSV